MFVIYVRLLNFGGSTVAFINSGGQVNQSHAKLGPLGQYSFDKGFFLSENTQLNRVGGVPERSKGSDCKSDGFAFEGSNPSPSTSIEMKQGLYSLEFIQGALLSLL